MRIRRDSLGLIPVVLAVLLASLALAQNKPPAAPTAAPASTPSTTETPSDEGLDVQIARARLRLAELALQKVEQMNQRVKQAVPADVVAEYRREVSVARARLDDALQPNDGNGLANALRTAEAAAQAAQARYQSALAVNQQQANTFDKLDVERLRARADLARLNLAQGRSMLDQPPLAQLQWRVSLLEEEVQRLREQASRSAPSGQIYTHPLWWW